MSEQDLVGEERGAASGALEPSQVVHVWIGVEHRGSPREPLVDLDGDCGGHGGDECVAGTGGDLAAVVAGLPRRRRLPAARLSSGDVERDPVARRAGGERNFLVRRERLRPLTVPMRSSALSAFQCDVDDDLVGERPNALERHFEHGLFPRLSLVVPVLTRLKVLLATSA